MLELSVKRIGKVIVRYLKNCPLFENVDTSRRVPGHDKVQGGMSFDNGADGVEVLAAQRVQVPRLVVKNVNLLARKIKVVKAK